MPRDTFDRKLLEAIPKLRPFAIRFCDGDCARADDLVQSTMLRVLLNRDKYRHDTNFSGWCYTTMRNIFINDTAMAARHRHCELADNHATSGWDAHSEMDEQFITSRIESLPDMYRRPFDMLGSGYSYEEISDAMNLPVNTTKSRINRARRKLRSQMSPHF